jgi:proline iminopeptidase
VAIADVNGVQLFFDEVGTGPTSLVLHGGLGLDHTLYRSLDPLAASLRLVYYDHRGNGRSSRPDESELTMEHWADDAAALARYVGGAGGVVVIGHSFGGFIAQEMAITHGDVVRALILVTTTPGQLGVGEAPSPPGPPIPDEFVDLLREMPSTDADLAAGMARLAPAYLHAAPTDRLTSLMAETVFSAVAMRRGFEELASWSAVDRLDSVHIPTLVIAGRHDAFTSWPQSERIAARLPEVEVVVFEHSGHFPWLEEPAAFFGAITNWLRAHDIVA